MSLFCALELTCKLASVSPRSLITIRPGDKAKRVGHNCTGVEHIELGSME